MTPLEELLAERIRDRGPMPFAAFMSFALYHPSFGYYSKRPRTGWSGHFVTSPEIDPAFGRLWARGVEEVWTNAGRPEPFHIVEVGPGEGGFARALLDALPKDVLNAVRYVLVERSVSGRQRQAKALREHGSRVRWIEDVTDLQPVDHGFLFANEVLDNLPVHLAEMHDGRLTELCVDLRDGRFVFRRLPPSSPHLESFLRRVSIEPRDGYRYEIPLASEAFVRRCASAVQLGCLVLIDYGMGSRELATKPRGTLACYSASGVDDDPLSAVGQKDITAHANWTWVSDGLARAGLDVHGPIPQHRVLVELGAGQLDRDLREQHDAALRARRGADAVAALSSRQALSALMDRNGLGSLGVLSGTRGIAVPSFANARSA